MAQIVRKDTAISCSLLLSQLGLMLCHLCAGVVKTRQIESCCSDFVFKETNRVLFELIVPRKDSIFCRVFSH